MQTGTECKLTETFKHSGIIHNHEINEAAHTLQDSSVIIISLKCALPTTRLSFSSIWQISLLILFWPKLCPPSENFWQFIVEKSRDPKLQTSSEPALCIKQSKYKRITSLLRTNEFDRGNNLTLLTYLRDSPHLSIEVQNFSVQRQDKTKL